MEIKLENRFILTPFFFDRYDGDLADLAQPDWSVNHPSLPQGDEKIRSMAVHKPLVDLVTQSITENRRPVSIAGDCCATIPVMAGLERAGVKPVFIWFDAHGDFNTWETSPSGFLGGMPLAMMVGKGEQTMVENTGMNRFPESDIIITDGRDLDPGERELIEASDVTLLPDIFSIMDLSFGNRPLYVHFDTDILDPTEAPAMGYLAPGGPSSDDLEKVFRHLASTCRISAVSMSTWRPNMDVDGKSKAVCLRLLKALIEN